MFAKKVQATIWNDELAKKSNRSCGYQARDPRRNFVATYIFDDGFESKAQCLEHLRHCGFREQDFLLVRFTGQWYAVNFQSYGSHLLVTAEGFLYQGMAFQTTERIGEEEARTLRIDPAWPDNKMWQDGIMQDLLLLDKNLYIESNGKPVPADSILFNNAAIIFGIPFFITEICIRTSSYTDHVLRNYYSDASLDRLLPKIDDFRKDGVEYYNPFRDTFSLDEKAKRKKEKVLLGTLSTGPVVKRPEQPGGGKQMRDREAYDRRHVQRDRYYQPWWNMGRFATEYCPEEEPGKVISISAWRKKRGK